MVTIGYICQEKNQQPVWKQKWRITASCKSGMGRPKNCGKQWIGESLPVSLIKDTPLSQGRKPSVSLPSDIIVSILTLFSPFLNGSVSCSLVNLGPSKNVTSCHIFPNSSFIWPHHHLSHDAILVNSQLSITSPLNYLLFIFPGDVNVTRWGTLPILFISRKVPGT